MHIRVDADACPAVIKDILFHVADRLPLTLVANRCAGAAVAHIRALQVPIGFNVPRGLRLAMG